MLCCCWLVACLLLSVAGFIVDAVVLKLKVEIKKVFNARKHDKDRTTMTSIACLLNLDLLDFD